MKEKYPIHDPIPIPEEIRNRWQETLDLMARLLRMPAGLIMRVHGEELEVFLRSRTEGNPYRVGERAKLETGLYCETVMDTRRMLSVPDALADPAWAENPDVELGMVAYLGVPLLWPDGAVFGTLCILDAREQRHTEEAKEILERFRRLVEPDLALACREWAVVGKAPGGKTAERELEEKRLLLETALYNAPVILWALDGEGRFLLSEGKGLEGLGLAPGQVIGRSTRRHPRPEILQ